MHILIIFFHQSITEDTPRELSPTVGEKSPGNSPWEEF
jgi:hypothetical protein